MSKFYTTFTNIAVVRLRSFSTDTYDFNVNLICNYPRKSKFISILLFIRKNTYKCWRQTVGCILHCFLPFLNIVLILSVQTKQTVYKRNNKILHLFPNDSENYRVGFLSFKNAYLLEYDNANAVLTKPSSLFGQLNVSPIAYVSFEYS